ncbi:MAG TPA: hypothetical protein VLE23_01870 [Geminicoccaceae bacterium]|nr:hypothetical protein [Geminicoccaceae bacterium]
MEQEVAQVFGFTLVYRLVLMVLLSSFMAITAYSFLNTRVKKRQEEYARAMRFLGVGDDQAAFATRAVIDEYDGRSYIVPVATATFVTLFGMFSLLFASDLVGLEATDRNVILTALFAETEQGAGRLSLLRWQSMTVLTLAFLGAYIWSCHNIIRRLVAGDLAPVEYYNTALRMIFAPLLSLMLAFMFEALGAGEAMRETMPVIAFMTGMLPGAALHYLQERFLKLVEYFEDSAHALSLGMIEGMNRHHEVRLSEVGIDNAQNLAEANLVELILRTPFGPDQLLDWIAQAQLYVYVKDKIQTLRRYGIRTALDLYEVAEDEARLSALAEDPAIDPLALRNVARRIGSDSRVGQLVELRRRLGLEAARARSDALAAPTNGADAEAAPSPSPAAPRAPGGERWPS